MDVNLQAQQPQQIQQMSLLNDQQQQLGGVKLTIPQIHDEQRGVKRKADELSGSVVENA